jgi:hypothetical protein
MADSLKKINIRKFSWAYAAYRLNLLNASACCPKMTQKKQGAGVGALRC